MPLSLLHSPNYANNITFTDYFQKQNRTVVLLTHYRESNQFYETINSIVIEELILLDLENINRAVLPEKLKSFFVDLNWKINAQFRSTDGFEKGVSLFLAVIEGSSICYVSLGRFFCTLIGNGLENRISDEGKNFHVKTKEELCLLGSLEQDIIVMPIIVEVKEGQQFVCCSTDLFTDTDQSSLNVFNIQSVLRERFNDTPFSYCILYSAEVTKPVKRSWIKAKRFRFTVLAMILTLIFSVYYLFRGDNTIEDTLHITREQFLLNVRNIDVLKLQELIPLDYGILLVPQRNIELFVEWESSLPFNVTLPPQYDLRQIFLASNNRLFSYDKREKNNLWTIDLPQRMTSIEVLDANLMIVSTTHNKSYCLKRDTGDIVWERNGEPYLYGQDTAPVPNEHKRRLYGHKPVQVSLEMDRRLNNSIILFPDTHSLTLVNILNGDTLYYYKAESKIDHISDFDFIEKSIYMVKGNRLLKVRFDIRA